MSDTDQAGRLDHRILVIPYREIPATQGIRAMQAIEGRLRELLPILEADGIGRIEITLRDVDTEDDDER